MTKFKNILIILVAIIFIPIGCCYGTAFSYVIFMGETTAMNILPQYPDSELQHTEYTRNGIYLVRTDVYRSYSDIQDLRAWYHRFIPMSPFDGILREEDKTYESLNHLSAIDFNSNYLNLIVAANITYAVHPDFQAIDIYPYCFDVKLLTGDAILQSEHLAQISMTNAGINLVYSIVTVCWPNY